MKVILCNQNRDKPTHLHMEPESDRDGVTLERLIDGGHTIGFGRDPETCQVIHAQIKTDIQKAAAAMGRAKSEAKAAASRANGAKGGRPRSRHLSKAGK